MPPKKSQISQLADKEAQKVSDEKLSISFEYLDLDSEEFFIHGLTPEYYKKVFKTITTIKSSKEHEITQQSHPSLNPKSIFRTDTAIRDEFPYESFAYKLFLDFRRNNIPEIDAKKQADKEARNITLSSAFEIRIGKNWGRIHGFVWSNVFHVIWFDPAHNLYPGKGKIEKFKDVATVKCYSPDEFERLTDKIAELEQELKKKEADIDDLLGS